MSGRQQARRQLSGFGELLDWRPLEFVDTVPNVFCCTLCGVMPAFPKRLTTCCHVFCQPCFEKLVERERRCPLDQTPFAEDAVETLDSVHGGINQLRAHCPNASGGCTVVAALPDLKEHVAESCDHNQVQCPRCGASFLQKTALSHYLEECTGARKVASPVLSEASSAASADRSDEDSYRRSGRRAPHSLKGLDKAGCWAGEQSLSVGARKAASAENAALAENKPKIIAAIRSLLQESHGGTIRSASRGASRAPSVETSLIKISRRSGSSSKPDLVSTRDASAKSSKSADGVVPETDKTLSERQLLDKVDSMLARAMETAAASSSSADDAAEAATTEPAAADVAEASMSSSSSSGSGAAKKPSASSSSTPRHRSRRHGAGSSKRAKAVAARTGAVSPPGFACCYIQGVVGAEARVACGEELVLRSDSSQLADCVFRVHARLRRDAEGSVLVCFTLCLCGGTWRQVAEWALANKISLLLVHPWDQAQNRRLPLCLNPDSVPLPKDSVPHPGRWDFWSPTGELKLKELAAGGFVSSGAICIALEIE